MGALRARGRPVEMWDAAMEATVAMGLPAGRPEHVTRRTERTGEALEWLRQPQTFLLFVPTPSLSLWLRRKS